MSKISVLCHAKINLTLDVVNKRSDGYHNIRSVMQSLRLADQVSLNLTSHRISLFVEGGAPSGQANLAYRAAKLFFHHSKLPKGVDIKLTKNIPIAAGLGGGSADAAGVLYGLNQLCDKPFTSSKLQSLGATLGADIPFCLQGGTQLALGTGTELSRLPSLSEHWWIALVKPQESISTKEAYNSLKPEWFGDFFTSNFLKEYPAGNGSYLSLVGNVMERVTVPRVKKIDHIKQVMLDGGAKAALMSGSGPTVFGIFTDKQSALKIKDKLAEPVIITSPADCGVQEVRVEGREQ